MGKKELIANRQYTDEFKAEAVRLGESIGGNQAAKRLGIPEASLWNWIKLSRAGKLKAAEGAAVLVGDRSRSLRPRTRACAESWRAFRAVPCAGFRRWQSNPAS